MALINLRNALMSGKRLPYDAEVEYLQSSGTQYINTGVLPANNMSFDCAMMFTELTSGDHAVLDSRSSGGTRFQMAHTYANKWTVAIGGSYDANGAAVSINTFYQLHGEASNGQTLTLFANGSQVATLTATGGISTVPIYALARNLGTNVDAYSKARIYSLKIYVNGVLVRDYIPVRKGTVGYLYDRVSGKLFGNAGTGDFVLGPDVVPVEYIESHGTEYINLQVSVASGNSLTLNMTGSFTGTSSAMQLHGVNGGAYFGLQTNGNYTVGGQDTGVARDSADHVFALSATIGNSQVVSLGIDGNTYTRTRNNSAGYIGLFNLLDASGGNPLTYYSKFRMKDASIAVNSATVRTMKPIRVGTDATSWEGAMMDVPTRRIYRNAGTGAFAYGNDLKYPIPAL